MNDFTNSPPPSVTKVGGGQLNNIEPINTEDYNTALNRPLLSFANPGGGLSPESSLENAFKNASKDLPDYAQNKNTAVLPGTETSIIPSLRYNDPEIGYTPFNPNLEDKYARANVGQNWINNLAGFGTKALGSFASTLSSIPLAIAYIGQDNYVSKVLGDNPFSEAISEWTRTVDENLPVYRTNAENENPILKYLDFTDGAAFSNTWGSVLNNLGFTVGAIAGGIVETALLTAVTGGTGFFPVLAKNVGSVTTAIGRIGRITAASPNLLRAGEIAVNGFRIGDKAFDALRGTAQVAPDLLSSKKAMDVLSATVRGGNSVNKIKDGFVYSAGLFSSAHGEGLFEGSEVYHTTYNTLLDNFTKVNGREPSVEELSTINKTARNSANITVGANLAVLYLSNRINWGSLFKPTSQVIKGTTISGWGKTIGKEGIQDKLTDGKLIYEVFKKVPETTLGKVFLNGQKVGAVLAKGLTEGVEEGTQFTISQGSIDYAMRSYNAKDRKETVDFMTSFIKGLSETVGTNEGVDNIMAGFIGGLVGGGAMRASTRNRAVTNTERLNQQIDALNGSQLINTFLAEEQLNEYTKALSDPTYKSSEGVLSKIDDMTKQLGLGKAHQEAIKRGEIKKAKDIQDLMAFNHWGSAQRNGVLQARKEELDAVRNLEGDSFLDYWGMEYTTENIKKAHSFLDKQLSIADAIGKNVQDAFGFRGRNPFNKQTNYEDWKANEDYTMELARLVTSVDTNTVRLTELQNNLRNQAPLLNLNKALQLTSNDGLKQISRELSTEIKGLTQQISEMQNIQGDNIADLESREHRKDLQRRLNKLEALQEELDSISSTDPSKIMSDRFIAKKYIDTIRKTWQLRNGVSLVNNDFVNDDLTNNLDFVKTEIFNNNSLTDEQLADNLEAIQDMYQLAVDRNNAQKYYNFLVKQEGETEYARAHREAMNKAIEETNKILEETPEVLNLQENETESIRQEEYENIDHPDTLHTTDKENIKNASRKPEDEWSEEEALSVDQNPEVFNQYKEAEVKAQERIMRSNTEALLAAIGEPTVQATTTVNKDFNGLKPEHLLFGMFLNNKYLTDSIKGVQDVLFNQNTTIKDFNNEVELKLSQRHDLWTTYSVTSLKARNNIRNASSKEEVAWTKEEKDTIEKYPGLLEEYKELEAQERDSKTQVFYKNKPTDANQTYTQLYRQNNFEVITVYNKGKAIGELRNPFNIYYKDSDNNYQPIFDNKGILNINANQYASFTNNSVSSFNAFKEQGEAYAKSYINAFNKIATDGKSNIGTFFDTTINIGSTQISRNSSTDIPLSEVELNNSVIIEATPILVDNSISDVEIKLKTKFGSIKQDQAEKIVNTIKASPSFRKTIASIKSTKKKMTPYLIAVFPSIDSGINNNSFIRARAEGKLNKEGIRLAIDNPAVYINTGLNFRGKTSTDIEVPRASANSVLASDLKVHDVVIHGRKEKIIAIITNNEQGVYRIDFTDGTKAINLLPNKASWEFKKVKSSEAIPSTSFLDSINPAYNGVNIKFENNLDKALYSLSRLSKDRTARLYGQVLDYLQQYFKKEGSSLKEDELLRTGQELIEVIDSKVTVLDSGITDIDFPSYIYHKEEVFETTKDKYMLINSNDLTKQGSQIQKDVRQKADRNTISFDIIQKAIEDLGYIIRNTSKRPSSYESNVIYLVDEDYITFNINNSYPDQATFIGNISHKSVGSNSKVNTNSLWEAYTVLYTSPKPEPVIDSRLSEIEEAKNKKIETADNNPDLSPQDKLNVRRNAELEAETKINKINETITEDSNISDTNQELISDNTVIEKVETVKITKEEQKVVDTVSPYIAKNKTELISLLRTGLFGTMTKEQAFSMATIMDMWATQQVIEGNFKNKQDAYLNFKYGGVELYNQLLEQRKEDSINLLFNKRDFPTLQEEINDVKKSNKYPTTSYLSEYLWYITKTPSFKKWFGNSITVDENGDPLIQWHWSPSTTITEFNLSGLGSHVGTREAADYIKEQRSLISMVGDTSSGEYKVVEERIEGKFYPLFIKLENPLPIEEFGQHDLGRYRRVLVQAFTEQGINLTDDDLSFFNETTKNSNGEFTPQLKDLLNKYGFDGFVYNNLFEDFGEVSYIAVDKAQLKLVSATAFNTNTGNIYNQQNQSITIEDVNKCL